MFLRDCLSGIRARLRRSSLGNQALLRGSCAGLRRGLLPLAPCFEALEERALLSIQPIGLTWDSAGPVFVSNLGQADASVAYVSQGADIHLSLARNAAVYAFGSSGRAAVSMTWPGGNDSPDVFAWEELPESSSFRRVRYDDVYDGIDLDFYGRDRHLEFDWIVAPGADPSQVTMAYAGMDGLALDAGGNLVISAAGEQLTQHAPFVYQIIAGVQREVASQYRLVGNTVGFVLAEYDSTLPLVIDPVLSYSTYLGGSKNDYVADIATDSVGNTYVIGSTYSPDLIDQSTEDTELSRAFLTKFTPAGEIVYTTLLGPEPNTVRAVGANRSA